MNTRNASLAAAAILGALAVFQLLLVLGLPLGQFAWGGFYEGVLPDGLRVASLIAIGVVALAMWFVLGAAGQAGPEDWRLGMTIGTLFFAAYFALNTLGNLMSASLVEKLVMTPVSALLCALFAYVGMSAWRQRKAKARP